MKSLKSNYHTHTTRCNHAEGSDEAYVLSAIEAGFTHLGFSDHGPWPMHPLERQWIRMKPDEMDDYVASVLRLKRQYAAKIDIRLGLEYEFYEERFEHIQTMKERYQLDFVILGHHFNEYESRTRYYGNSSYDQSRLLKDYETGAIKAIESGVYTMFAHPDLYAKGLVEWSLEAIETSERILLSAKQHNIPVEYNLGGVRNRNGRRLMYPYDEFWKLAAKIENTVIIGVDAHSPLDLTDVRTYEEAELFLSKTGCQWKVFHELD
jgi:histidinol-phosphatase (PHP family)